MGRPKRRTFGVFAFHNSVLIEDAPGSIEANELLMDLGGEPPMVRPGKPKSGRVDYHVAKRILDLVFSLAMIVVLSPVVLVFAIMVKISSAGSVFFRQERVGRYGEVFVLLKFRTMLEGADESYHREHYEQRANGDPREMLISEDPRVTRVGAFLRRWSGDEIPNLWNVVKGDMSLVGPRPLVPYELVLFRPEQLRRLEVLPGITGLAQVEGRLNISMDQRSDHDLEYVDRHSFLYDLVLLARTVPALLTRHGA